MLLNADFIALWFGAIFLWITRLEVWSNDIMIDTFSIMIIFSCVRVGCVLLSLFLSTDRNSGSWPVRVREKMASLVRTVTLNRMSDEKLQQKMDKYKIIEQRLCRDRCPPQKTFCYSPQSQASPYSFTTTYISWPRDVEIRGEPVEELLKTTYSNALQFFNLQYTLCDQPRHLFFLCVVWCASNICEKPGNCCRHDSIQRLFQHSRIIVGSVVTQRLFRHSRVIVQQLQKDPRTRVCFTRNYPWCLQSVPSRKPLHPHFVHKILLPNRR
jgi:hypothetical protein